MILPLITHRLEAGRWLSEFFTVWAVVTREIIILDMRQWLGSYYICWQTTNPVTLPLILEQVFCFLLQDKPAFATLTLKGQAIWMCLCSGKQLQIFVGLMLQSWWKSESLQLSPWECFCRHCGGRASFGLGVLQNMTVLLVHGWDGIQPLLPFSCILYYPKKSQ